MKKALFLRITIFAVFAALSASCSSAPKNAGDIYHLRSLAEKELDLANREAGRGNFDLALSFLVECKRRAVLADDMSLTIRSCLSLGNVLFSVNRREEAFAEWEQAIDLSQELKNSELLSVSRIFNARGKLLSGGASAQAVLDEVTREASNIKSDNLYIALSWQVRGLALRGIRSFSQAEDAVKRSLDIHLKERYLENASYDWYLIASIRSLSGNAAGAISALEEAIALDRRIENSWGLAASWRAAGDIYRNAGNSAQAAQAYNRARAIYLAMGDSGGAAEIDKRLGN
jgi:tetratricopeptide (TPR) repeat protein